MQLMVRSTLSWSFDFFRWREQKLFRTRKIDGIFFWSFSDFWDLERCGQFVSWVGNAQANRAWSICVLESLFHWWKFVTCFSQSPSKKSTFGQKLENFRKFCFVSKSIQNCSEHLPDSSCLDESSRWCLNKKLSSLKVRTFFDQFWWKFRTFSKILYCLKINPGLLRTSSWVIINHPEL